MPTANFCQHRGKDQVIITACAHCVLKTQDMLREWCRPSVKSSHSILCQCH